MVGGYWMDVLEMRVEMGGRCVGDGINVMEILGCTGRMRMLKYFRELSTKEICRFVER